MEIIKKLQNSAWWTERCLTDLYFLCRSIMQTLEDPTPGFKDLYAPTHKRLCSFVQRSCAEGHKSLILLPRGWVKSYIITVGWVLQRLLRNLVEGKREHMIISNATRPNAQQFLEKIKYNIAYNDRLRTIFAHVLPKSPETDAARWTMEEIDIAGNRIETGSVEGNLVSRHYKVMINDDLVNLENSLTAEQINKVVDWWKLAQSLLLPSGIEVTIGTRWNYEDLYGYIIDNFLKIPKDKKALALTEPILEFDNGKYHIFQASCWADPVNQKGSTFPHLFPEERLREIMNEQGDKFPGQYCNDPLSMSRNPFPQRWLKKWESESQIPGVRHTLMTIDPTGKEKASSDYTGMVVAEACVDKKIYVRYARHQRITDLKLVHWLIEVALEYEPTTIGIEEGKCGTVVAMLELELPRMLRCGEIPPEKVPYAKTLPYLCTELQHRGRPKRVRIGNLASWVESQRILFPPEDNDVVFNELIRFPSSMYDDVIDALAYLLDILVFPLPSDPVKHLSLPEDLKKTAEQREQDDWEKYLEDVYVDQPIYMGDYL